MSTEHPLRRQVVEEMHLRRWPAISTNTCVIQILRILEAADRAEEVAAYNRIPSDGILYPVTSPRNLSGQLSSHISFTWERHHEASALTLFIDHQDALGPDVPGTGPTREALDWALDKPGQIIRATHIQIVETEREATALLGKMSFELPELVSCHIGRSARMWSDLFPVSANGTDLRL